MFTARLRPGQTLDVGIHDEDEGTYMVTGLLEKQLAYRRPKPNAIFFGSIGTFCGFPASSSARNRSGLNSSGFGYSSGSWSISLRCKVSRFKKEFICRSVEVWLERVYAYHWFGRMTVPSGKK